MKQRWASRLRSWWGRHGDKVLCLAIVLMVILAVEMMVGEFVRLLLVPYPSGAIDTGLIHEVVHGWFAGQPIYDTTIHSNYPPASYVLLWPFYGWLGLEPARWLWAAVTLASLVWLVVLVIREGGADTALERVFVALLPLSLNA